MENGGGKCKGGNNRIESINKMTIEIEWMRMLGDCDKWCTNIAEQCVGNVIQNELK